MHLVLWWTFRIVAGLLVAATLPLVIELLLLTMASMLPASKPSRSAGMVRRLAVIVPAHNEALLIERCVRSLTSHMPAMVSICVIAHNCTDDTAERAAKAGADVLVVNDPEQRGKACALRSGFAHVLARGAEAVVVVDADSVVSENFLAAMQQGLSRDDDAVQCVYRVLPSNALAMKAGEAVSMTEIAFQGFNIVRPRGRERLGLSVGIFGNGFGLRREALERVPYQADSVVEDLEYHIQLVAAGSRVRLIEEATVYGEMPQGGKGSETQRARWEGGRLLMMRSLPGRLLHGMLRGNIRLAEPLLDVLALPLAMEALCLLLLVAIPVSWSRAFGFVGLAVVCVHFLAAVKAGPDFWQGMRVLLRVPRYIFWKLLLLPKIVLASRRNASWVRTQRSESSDFSSSPPADALE